VTVRIGIAALVVAGAGAAVLHAAVRTLPLRTVARVALPGPSNRFDYTSIDPQTNELYVAHMDAGRLLAVDLRSRKVVADVAAPGVHGVLAVPQLGRVFASATDAHEVLTLSARTHAVLAHAPAGSYPDGLAYDPVERRVYVSDETGGIETVIDARGRRVTSVQLGGEAGNAQYDPGSRRVLVDVQSRNDVAVMDRARIGSSAGSRSRGATTTTGCSSTRSGGSRSSRATGTRGS
jgi:DNA-binding beta-propeller fold protein YncE